MLDKVDFTHGFLCHKCNFPLVPNEEGDQGGHEQSTRLNAQFRFITNLLPKIDQVAIPDNVFEVAYARAKPVYRDELLNPANATAPIHEGLDRPTAVKGLTNTGPTSIAIELTSGEGPTEEDKAEAAAKRSAYLAQNALPEHFTHSTITGEKIVHEAGPAANKLFPGLKEEKEDKKNIVTTPSAGEGAAIDDYFAQLKAEQAREAEIEAEEEFETDDEEGEFEDVPAAATADASKAGTPSGTPSTLPSALKSADASRNSTPVSTADTGDEAPDRKKVKIEPPTPEVKKEDDEESEEDMEFEDV